MIAGGTPYDFGNHCQLELVVASWAPPPLDPRPGSNGGLPTAARARTSWKSLKVNRVMIVKD